ncbi:TFIIB-type zinc ribbon-containing protein [Halobacteria archaeon AArc-dxtr1]|nr:TFIIB-type zinc ribbon-containing protein [Halobacteria archaeon AArc-dxtr1]
MKIRGERTCRECGTQWSYYETGSIDCPACGSLRSVGTDERAEHTDAPVTFDLSPVRNAVDDSSTTTLAERARDRTREYVRQRGFISGGELQSLDDTYLAAAELLHVADTLARARQLEESEELYFISVLADADAGDRPPATEVPETLRAARGLAAAEAVREYRRDVRTWLEGSELTEAERGAFDALGEHAKRIRMLDGDVSPETAETLLRAAREVADALRGEEAALARAQDRLDELA